MDANRGRSKTAVRATTLMVPRALLTITVMAALAVGFHKLFSRLSDKDAHLYWFLCLFTWRYLRFVINLVAFWCYSPSPKPQGTPKYVPSRDVTAVIPTVDPEGSGFRECLRTCAENKPHMIIVVTAGEALFEQTSARVREFEELYPSVRFVVEKTGVANKRHQVSRAVHHISTDIAVLLDDHVFWGPQFLQTMLYAFENPAVGLVGTNKRVRRAVGLNLWGRIWNMLGATYLCRHNFEIRASNTVDGGVFVVSGRTCAIRTEILHHKDFLYGYNNERFFFGKFGPLNPDDDNYITRFVVRHGWQIKIQYTNETTMETTLGVEKPLLTKFLGQCRRWVRTTWRSNTCSLVTDRTVWARQPYCVYAVYLTSFTNFAAVVDPLLVYLFARSAANVSVAAVLGLVGWILFTKVVKVFEYFYHHPQDLVLFPAYLFFAYFHSFIKFWALLTFWDGAWSGRRLEDLQANDKKDSANQDKKDDDDDGHNSTHPHVPALRALCARVADLREQHAEHMTSYQGPLLAALSQLGTSFADLQTDQQKMRGNHETIHAELRRVAAQADEVAASQDKALLNEADLIAAVAQVQAAVGGVEERWGTYRAGLPLVAA